MTIEKVKQNKGVPGIDKMTVQEVEEAKGNIQKSNKACKCRFSEDDIYKCANTRLGWYRRSGMNIVNFIISLKVLSIKKGDRPGLVYHLDYYLKSDINVEPYTRHIRTVQWENKLSNLFLYPINEIEV